MVVPWMGATRLYWNFTGTAFPAIDAHGIYTQRKDQHDELGWVLVRAADG